MWKDEPFEVPVRSGTGVTGVLFMITVGGMAFYAGFNPGFFLTVLGMILLGLSMLSPFLFLLSIRAEQVSWKVSLTIVGILLAAIIMLIFVPTWYWFSYLPVASDPLAPAVQ